VLFVVSEEWLASKWCGDEYQLANRLNKKLFALLVDDVALDRLPGGLTAQWQIVRLKGEPAERFLTVHPLTGRQSPVHIADAGLKSLKRGLDKAGIGTETFELQADPNGPFGWRAPYRGLEALEPEDAAVFFGRSADMVRGIDVLRGLAARKPPRLLVILGASGAGKSSFLRAGLWPRLNRDDSQWLPLKAIRAGRGGAIEGSESLLSAIEDVHRRFALRASRADLRERLATTESFIDLLRELRQTAARRALLSEPPYPLPILCLDQAEELFAAEAGPESEKLLLLARAAIDADAALFLVTIRSDTYGAMQSAPLLAGIDQVPLSLGPVPHGEIGRVIREPAEILRRKAGPVAPLFDAAVIERLQTEIEGEEDALPLLAFVLQRLMREHQGVPVIGIVELDRTGGVSAAIETASEAALDDAGIGRDRASQRDALRRLFIPRLARIDRESKAPQRHVARQTEVPADLLPLARALTQRRLLVVKLAAQLRGGAAVDTATLEVAHEALLRRWPTLADLLAEDRDALLLLDGALSAAADWEKAEAERKPDFLAHRGSRLADALTLASRDPDWAREIAPARTYLAACQARETAEREEKEAALAREKSRLAEIAAAQERTSRLQRRTRWVLSIIAAVVACGFATAWWLLNRSEGELHRGQVNLLSDLAEGAKQGGNFDSALRFAVYAARRALQLDETERQTPLVRAEMAALSAEVSWRLVLLGHTGRVLSAEFSPDDTRIATTSNDATARIWNASTGKTTAVLSGHSSPLLGAARFSPDGSRVITTSWDKTARIWDTSSGTQINILTGHTSAVSSAAFSPDGSRIVTSSYDKTARIWNAATSKQLIVLQHDGPVTSAVFSPDGSRIVTASSDKTVRIWNSATGELITVMRGHQDIVNFAAFNPDGSRIVSASADSTVRLWDAATGKQIRSLPGHHFGVASAVFSPDGSRIVSASEDGTARLWNASTGGLIVVLRANDMALTDASFSHDGSRIATSSWDKTARVWDAGTQHETAVLNGHNDVVFSAAYSPDGTRIVTASYDKTARIWDAATGHQIAVLSGHTGQVFSASFSADGSRILTASWDGTAWIWDAATGNNISTIREQLPLFSAAYSPDGGRIVTASQDYSAHIYDAASGKQLLVLNGHSGWVTHAAFSPDGSRIVTSSYDGTARLWETTTGRQLQILSGHNDIVWTAAFSPDGSRIITSSHDKTARIWDAATGTLIAILTRHESFVASAAYSPDGSRIATASSDSAARIWDAATFDELAVLRGNTDELRSVAFSPDGSHVVTASQDHTAVVWNARFEPQATTELVRIACAHLLTGSSTLTRIEMHLAGYPDTTPEIDACTQNE
jgi:WD40 repeat protein